MGRVRVEMFLPLPYLLHPLPLPSKIINKFLLPYSNRVMGKKEKLSVQHNT